MIAVSSASRSAAVLLCAVAIMVVRTPHPGERRVAVEIDSRSASDQAFALALSLDVWSEESPMVLVVSSAKLDALAGIPHRIVVDDIDEVADQERTRLAKRARASWFSEYRDLHEVDDYMAELVVQHPELVSERTIGWSLEGRPIHELTISRGGAIGIALDGAQHAREWISVMVPICVADRLVAARNEPRITKILDAASFHIVPVVNPDGYAYSWTHDRYWRKNRRGGYGVDLNRNYGVGWGQPGSSPDHASPNYRGEAAFSEPESRAVRSWLQSTSIRAHIDFHNYSQVILYPWSYQKAPPPDRERFAAIADRMSTAMFAAHGQRYAIRAGSELKTSIGGTLADWAYSDRGVLSFLVELRPTSKREGGFVLPPSQIAPTCDESEAAVLELAEAMIGRGLSTSAAKQ
jgi:murein tripeptide amidase MpaA